MQDCIEIISIVELSLYLSMLKYFTSINIPKCFPYSGTLQFKSVAEKHTRLSHLPNLQRLIELCAHFKSVNNPPKQGFEQLDLWMFIYLIALKQEWNLCTCSCSPLESVHTTPKMGMNQCISLRICMGM